MESIVRDLSLAPSGALKIAWVKDHMPILSLIEQRFIKEQPFKGLRISMSIHLEAKTARTALLLKAGGADVYATGCNPLSTQDDVAAALSQMGVKVNAWYNATEEEYHDHLIRTLSCKPHILIDDGGDLTHILCDERPDLAHSLLGGGEETTTGVMRLRARAAEGNLPFPMICVNDAQMKYLFDNRYGTGQSVWDGIMRTTNLVVASKNVVVAGYGWCGKGVAMRAKGLGARVIVCEVNPIKAVEAAMDGFDVMSMEEAAKVGDLFVTVTGCKDIITMKHVPHLKQGAILCNAGHFNVEVAVEELKRTAKVTKVHHNIEALDFEGGKRVYLLADGRLVNLAAGDGHPAEIMDISFALQALTAEYVAKHYALLPKAAIELPEELDEMVAQMKLQTMGLSIDALTEEQSQYIHSSNG
ncbi:adenosylhomocysteinase [Eubacteriales bacterium OttesenSCG-928-N13]|nr:adenosylhomocysteinase [Eubacteriales bacterium OttesenSCG-928-N13]